MSKTIINWTCDDCAYIRKNGKQSTTKWTCAHEKARGMSDNNKRVLILMCPGIKENLS